MEEGVSPSEAASFPSSNSLSLLTAQGLWHPCKEVECRPSGHFTLQVRDAELQTLS